MSTPLTLYHLAMDAVAQEPLHLGQEHAGERLRNALAAVMLPNSCGVVGRGQTPTPTHIASCPACALLAAEQEPGQARRAYAVVPPLPPRETLAPGDAFRFGLTLFGAAGWRAFPYFALLLPEMARAVLFGQGIQVGKLTVKGNGLFDVALPGQPLGYWAALSS